MQREQICGKLETSWVLMQVAAMKKNLATVERTLPFARTSSEWNPGWKQLGTPTGHGRAWAESGLKDQENGEELGRAEKEEEIGELAGAGRLKVVKEGRGGIVEGWHELFLLFFINPCYH